MKVLLDCDGFKKELLQYDFVKIHRADRFDRFRKKNRKVNVYYIECSGILELSDLCRQTGLDFAITKVGFDMDGTEFGLIMQVSRQDSKRKSRVSAAA